MLPIENKLFSNSLIQNTKANFEFVDYWSVTLPSWRRADPCASHRY